MDEGWAGKNRNTRTDSSEFSVLFAGKRWQVLATKAENLNTLHRYLWPALQRVGKKDLKLFEAENVLTNGPIIKTQDTKTQKTWGTIGKHLISQKSKYVDG